MNNWLTLGLVCFAACWFVNYLTQSDIIKHFKELLAETCLVCVLPMLMFDRLKSPLMIELLIDYAAEGLNC